VREGFVSWMAKEEISRFVECGRGGE